MLAGARCRPGKEGRVRKVCKGEPDEGQQVSRTGLVAIRMSENHRCESSYRKSKTGVEVQAVRNASEASVTLRPVSHGTGAQRRRMGHDQYRLQRSKAARTH
jgi:hypothetical protein